MIALFAAVVLFVPCALAQEVAWVATGAPDRNIHGFRMTGIGDVNQDGYEDLLTIGDGHCGGAAGSLGVLRLVSGRDGSFLRELVASLNVFVAIERAGDWNGDGVPDYAVCQGGPVLEVRSGTDDVVLWSVSGGGDQILGDIDLDGDGQRDILVGDWHAHGYLGQVRAYAHNGTLLYTLLGDISPTANPPLAIANEFARLGDVDNDGCDDYVMGCLDLSGRGCSVIVSGATGTYLRFCYGELPGDGAGIQITACGDLDGDGFFDFAAGNGGGLFMPRGVVRVFSTRTGNVLHQWTGQPGSQFSRGLAGGVDLDGDGVPDVVAGEDGFYTATSVYGRVMVFSGRDGARLHVIKGQPPQAGATGNIGAFTTVLRPPVGEHRGLLVVDNKNTLFGTGSTCGHHYGALVAYRGLPRTAVEFGPGCPGLLPSMPNIGMSSLGSAGVRVHLSNAPPNGLAVLLLGLSTTSHQGVPLPIALDPMGLPGCDLHTSIELAHTAIAGAAGVAAGHAAIDLPYPVPTTGVGTWSLSVQWWVVGDAATFPGAMSQAIRWNR